jgi:hypothetical protein
MQKTYKSLYAQVAYVLMSGLPLLLFPNPLLVLLGFEPTQEIWIRVLGLLVSILSIYYLRMAKYGNDQVVMATVYGRLVFCAVMVLFVILGMGKPMLIAFALVESIFAFWTWQEVKRG